MVSIRRVVLDTSVFGLFYFPEGNRQAARRAERAIIAVRHHAVVAFAPDALLAEFLKMTTRVLSDARRLGMDVDNAQIAAEAQWADFLQLPIIFTHALDLSSIAGDAALHHSVPAPDSWFLACSVWHEAELWFSHPHADRAGEWATRYGAEVRYLSETPFT